MAAELSSVEGQRVNGSALLRAAGMIRMIVRIVLAEGEFHLGIRFEEGDHGAGVLQERLDPRLVKVIAGLVPNVSPRLIERVVDSLPRRKRVSRYPQPSARARGRAAEQRRLLDNEHVQSEVMGGNGCGH